MKAASLMVVLAFPFVSEAFVVAPPSASLQPERLFAVSDSDPEKAASSSTSEPDPVSAESSEEELETASPEEIAALKRASKRLSSLKHKKEMAGYLTRASRRTQGKPEESRNIFKKLFGLFE